jgi:hypothetical protein
MARALKVSIKPEEIIQAVKEMKKNEREAFLENLLAATSPEYLKSITDAREDYRSGRVRTHKEVFAD